MCNLATRVTNTLFSHKCISDATSCTCIMKCSLVQVFCLCKSTPVWNPPGTKQMCLRWCGWRDVAKPVFMLIRLLSAIFVLIWFALKPAQTLFYCRGSAIFVALLGSCSHMHTNTHRPLQNQKSFQWCQVSYFHLLNFFHPLQVCIRPRKNAALIDIYIQYIHFFK